MVVAPIDTEYVYDTITLNFPEIQGSVWVKWDSVCIGRRIDEHVGIYAAVIDINSRGISIYYHKLPNLDGYQHIHVADVVELVRELKQIMPGYIEATLSYINDLPWESWSLQLESLGFTRNGETAFYDLEGRECVLQILLPYRDSLRVGVSSMNKGTKYFPAMDYFNTLDEVLDYVMNNTATERSM